MLLREESRTDDLCILFAEATAQLLGVGTVLEAGENWTLVRSESPEVPASRAFKAQRDPLIDGLRFVSAIGIVWFHAHAPGATFAYAGLSLFLIMTFYFESRRSIPKPLPRAAYRYLVPWAFWFLFYGVERLVRLKTFFPDYGHSASAISNVLVDRI